MRKITMNAAAFRTSGEFTNESNNGANIFANRHASQAETTHPISDNISRTNPRKIPTRAETVMIAMIIMSSIFNKMAENN